MLAERVQAEREGAAEQTGRDHETYRQRSLAGDAVGYRDFPRNEDAVTAEPPLSNSVYAARLPRLVYRDRWGEAAMRGIKPKVTR